MKCLRCVSSAVVLLVSVALLSGRAMAKDTQDFASTKPVPRNDVWWQARHKSMNDRVKKGNVDLLMINAALPDVSGWLLSRKLRLIDPEVAIWLYTPQASADEVSMANFVMADELIEYDGNLWRLSGEIADRLGTPAEVPLPQLSNHGSHVPAFATA